MDTVTSPPANAPAPDWLGHGPIGRAERRLAGLEHLAGVGIRLADAFAEKAFTAANTAWIEPDCHVDPGIPFAGMVRVVRQTYALQQKFEKEARRAAVAEATRHDPDRRARHVKRRRLVKDAVTEAIKDTADPSDAERLFRDLEERLHDEEADERFDDGPVGQVVARICKALGVSIDLTLYEDADVQRGTSNRDAQPRPTEPTTSQPAGRPAAPRPDALRTYAPRPSAPNRDTQSRSAERATSPQPAGRIASSRPDAPGPDAPSRDTQSRSAEPATSPQPAGRSASSRPDAPRPDAANRDTPRPPATRPPDTHPLAGPRITGIFRPGEPSALEKYLGPPPPPKIPRWPR